MIYLILSFNLVFAILVAIYWLFFRDGHAFRFNRYLLLALPLLALLLPQIPRPVEVMQRSVTDRVQEQIPFAANPFMEDKASAKKTSGAAQGGDDGVSKTPVLPPWLQTLTWAKVLLSLYLAGVLLFFGRHLRQWWQLTWVLRRSERLPSSAYRLVRAPDVQEPFSFFQWIVLPQKEFRYTDYQQILEHELVHVRQGHSWDIMLGEWLQILCWFNPAVKTYRSLVRNNLEYLVDDTLLHQGVDQRTYQYSLLSVSLGGQAMSMATNYNHSFIKKRIQMMNTTKIKRMPFWKGGLILLQVLAILQLFGQGLPPVSKGMDIVLVGNGATFEELAELQDRVDAEIEDAIIGVSDVEYMPDGTFRSITVRFTDRTGTGTSTYNPSTPGMPFLPRFISHRKDGKGSTIGALESVKLEKILEFYDHLDIHTAGLDPSKENLEKLLPVIRQMELDRAGLVAEQSVKQGSKFSYSQTFRLPEEEKNYQEFTEFLNQSIQKEQDENGYPLQYYLDGIPRDIELSNLKYASLSEVSLVTEGVHKILDGEQSTEGVIKLILIRKDPFK